MVRHRLLGPVRLTLVAALAGSMLALTAGVVSAAASITVSPGSTVADPTKPGNFLVPFTTTALDIDVDCGAPTSPCSVWVARNNAAKASEALFTNVTGARSLILVDFINDGCFNFRLYDSAHVVLVAQINVGHGRTGPGFNDAVCRADGTAAAAMLFGYREAYGDLGTDGLASSPPSFAHPVSWDSGFAGGVEESEVWVTESKPGRAFTNCASLTYPNANEVLYARNVSGEQTVNVVGGGPYCFALYQGTGHATKIAGPASYFINTYMQYTFTGATRINYSSGNGSVNALVCVYGSGVPGSDVNNQVAFTFNSEGWNPGGTDVPFQTVGFFGSPNTNTYTLRTGITNRNPDGSPTNRSCITGAAIRTFTVTT